MRTWIKLASLAAVVALAGAARADDKKNGDKPTGEQEFSDTFFVDHAYTKGQNEVLLGNLARQRAQNEEVRKFAERLVTDHTKANQDLILIVSAAKIAVPDRPLKEQQKDLDKLHSREVQNFDKEFMECMVKGHEAGVKLFERGSKELKNEQLKEFATKTLPTLKEHLTMAKEIHGKLEKGTAAGEVRTASTERTDDKAKEAGKALTDNEFVMKVASGGMAEVAIAKIAQEKAKDPEVKKFADRLVADHTKVNQELIRIAKDAGIPVPDKPEAMHEEMVKKFQSGSIGDFDKEFIHHMVGSHTKGVELFTKASKELKNEQLRSFAEKTLPTLKEHLEIAKRLHK